MTIKEELHERVEELTDAEAQNLLRFLREDSPTKLLLSMGPWEDSRSTEEIIKDIYDHRMISHREIPLDIPA